MLLVVLAVVLGLVLYGPAVLASVLIAVEFLIFLLLSVALAVFRTLFRRPWKVTARNADGREWTWQQVGYRSSRKLVAEIKQGLQSGLVPTGIAPDRLRSTAP